MLTAITANWRAISLALLMSIAVLVLLVLSSLAHAASPKPLAPSSSTAIAGAAAAAAAGASAAGGSSTASSTTTIGSDRPAPAVAAPGLTSFGGCKGSVAGGVSVPAFGVSFGTTVTDEECQRLNSATYLTAIGHSDAGLALACDNNGVRAAMAAVGKGALCPGGGAPTPITPAAAPAERHPACGPSGWLASREWRAAHCR